MVKPVVATLIELLHRWLSVHPTDEAVGYDPGDGTTVWLSTAELADRIRALSMGLRAAGVEAGDRVALLSENRWEWMVADFGILTAGAVSVPIHPGLTARQTAYILADSGARVALVSTPELTARVLEARRDAPGLATVISFDDTASAVPGVQPLAAVFDAGRAYAEAHRGDYRRRRDQVAPEDLASIIYTSGTTGDPKGVMLTHANFAYNATACCGVFDFLPSDLALSFLPLCHVFERTVDYCYYYSGCRVVHIGDLNQVTDSFARFRPTTFAAVPRLYEKMYARIQERVPPSRRWLVDWAVAQGRQAFRRQLAGRPPGPWLSMTRALARRLVFQKIRQGLGGRWRFSISGGAPLAAELSEFFNSVDLPVLEGYGLTETSPVIAINSMVRPKPGTVGRPLPGLEVRIAADGEVMTRGPHIMKGYWQAPDMTAKTIDAEGWLATGDLGVLDDQGYLAITDRKKEIIVTAQGKNIAPQPLENALKQLPSVSQAMVIGDRRPYLVALVVPDFEVLASRGHRAGTPVAEPAALAVDPVVRATIQAEMESISGRFAHHEQIRRFALLPRDFTQEMDEMTPTLKLKRRVIRQHFETEIEALYAGHPVDAAPVST